LYVDIAFNITDKAFEKGRDEAMERCRQSGVVPILVGLDYASSAQCIAHAGKYKTLCTVGLHPTHSTQSEDLELLRPLLSESVVVAAGECGLDYDRLEFSPKEDQKKAFLAQLDFGFERYFFHSRACHRDFMEGICDYRVSGVVHSFTGTAEEAEELVARNLFIGINGCSLKTKENVEVVRSIPLSSMVAETDSPYCKIRKGHASHVFVRTIFNELRRRNEPCCVVQVAETLSGIKDMDLSSVTAALLENTVRLYGNKMKETIDLWSAQ
jgi:TatD DNase family protein